MGAIATFRMAMFWDVKKQLGTPKILNVKNFAPNWGGLA